MGGGNVGCYWCRWGWGQRHATFDQKKWHEKIQNVSRDVLYVYQPTFEIWGLQLQNRPNGIKGWPAPFAGRKALRRLRGCRKKTTLPKLRKIKYTDLERLCLNIWGIGSQRLVCPMCFHLICKSWGGKCRVLWVQMRMRSTTCNIRPEKVAQKNPKRKQRCIICIPTYFWNLGS